MPFGILLDASGAIERDMRLIASDLEVEWVRYAAPEAVEPLVLNRAEFLIAAYNGAETEQFIQGCTPWRRHLPVCVYGLPNWKTTLAVTNAGACLVYADAPPPTFLHELLKRLTHHKVVDPANHAKPADAAESSSAHGQMATVPAASGWLEYEMRRVRCFADLDRALSIAAGSVVIHNSTGKTDPLAELRLYAESWGLAPVILPLNGKVEEGMRADASPAQLWIVDQINQFSPNHREELAESLRSLIASTTTSDRPGIVLPVPADTKGGNLIPPAVRVAFAGLFSVANWTQADPSASNRHAFGKPA